MGLPAMVAYLLKSRETHGYEPNAQGKPLWVLYVASIALVLLSGAFAVLATSKYCCLLCGLVYVDRWRSSMGRDSIYLRIFLGRRIPMVHPT
jgi:hypothetical protein